MISERCTALIEAANWEKRRTSSADSTPASSLKGRLAALTKSSETWHNRVKKDGELTKLNPASRRKILAFGKENSVVVGNDNEEAAPSKSALLLNLDKGLNSFFPHNTPTTIAGPIEMDLDSVGKTEILVTPRRPRLRKPGRGRAPADTRLNAINTEKVQIAEDPRDHVEALVVENDNSPVAKSAKKGLEAIEDYSAAKGALKEVDTTSPYPAKMLIRVKGEKKMDVRLVSPSASSVHSAGVFILVTPERLLKYEGEESNILERTKGAQICINITTKSDLCCTAKTVENCSSSAFCRLLTAADSREPAVLAVEPFENLAARINLVIRVTDDYQIQSVSKGERVRFSVLQPKDTLIFDFGSEIYVWSGRLARKTTGKYAVEYAQQLRTKPVPSSEAILGEDFAKERPGWILYRRVMQGVQDALFSSKFSDWQTNESKGYGTPMAPRAPCIGSPVTPRNNNQEARLLGDLLRSLEHPEPMTILEDQEITRTMRDIVTESIQFWQLQNEQLERIEKTSVFVNDQCYVVRWQYRIQISGVRRLKTGKEHEKETGRERVAFFYWLGSRTTPKQQGLCALKLSHMDKDKRPHLRIAQSFETPLFLQLFEGKLLVKSASPEAVPLFLVRGATVSEGHAFQLDDCQPLRTHAVYIQEEGKRTKLIVGTDCEETAVKNGLALSEEILRNGKQNSTAEVTSFVQGDDPGFSWLTAKGRTTCPRFYRIYETEADELHCPQYHKKLGFPLPQAKLIDTILVDVGEKLWIWSEKAPTTFALRVAETFWKGRRGEATVVLKGHEPTGFIAAFDCWSEWKEEEKTPPTPPRKLEELMVERTQTYSLDALRTRTGLPEGIDTKNLEQYLSDREFGEAFQMDRASFDDLPLWKQIRLRKDAGLF